MSGLDHSDLIDLPSDNSRDSGRQVDASVQTLAAVFGAVALPPGMPDFLKDHIEREANFAQALDTAGMTIGSMGGGPLDQKTKRERQEEQDQQAGDRLATAMEEIERERAQWAQTLSSVGGVEMTGAQWHSLAKRLRDDEDLHRRLIDAFERRGMTEDEAETHYKRVADVAEIAAIPPAQRTEEQQHTIEKADADPAFKTDIADVKRLAGDDPTTMPTPELRDNPAQNVAGGAVNANASVPIRRPMTAVDGLGM